MADPKTTKEKTAVREEVAAVFNPNKPYSKWNGNASWLLAYNPDDLVKSKGKGIKIYQDMIREPFVKAALQQKKTSLLSVPWGIKPASQNTDHIEQAKFAAWSIKHLKGGFARDIWEACDGLNVGYSLLEKVYDIVPAGKEWSGNISLIALKSKNPLYFGFDTDEFDNLLPNGVILTQAADGKTNVPLRSDKFFIFSYNKLYECFYGQSDLRAAYRAYWIKDTAWKLRAIYMERFSGNSLKGKYPRSNNKIQQEANKQTLLEIFRSWQNETGVALPNDIEIEVMQIATSSDSEYSRAMADCNKEIAIGILGETLTVDEGRKTGARNMGEIHAEVVDLLVMYLDMVLAADINEQIVRELVDLNWANVESYPEFYWYPREDYDPVQFGEAVQAWQAAGAQISKSWFYERTRMPIPSGDDDVMKPVKPESAAAPVNSGQVPPAIPAKAPDSGDDPKKTDKPTENMSEERSSSESGKYSRDLSKFELFAEIPKVDNRLKMLEEKAIALSQSAYDKIFNEILAQVEKKNVLASTDYSAAAKIAVNPAPLKGVFFQTMLTSNMLGRADVVVETQNQGYSFGKIKKFAEADDFLTMEKLFTPEEAANFFAGKVPMTREEYDALVQQIMDKAFYVSGLEKTAIERDMKNLITDALNNGMSLDTFKFKLQELQVKYTKPVYEREGVGQASADDTVLDYHAETVFRTNIMNAYNEGKSAIYGDPDIKEFFPAYEYTAIMDGRTTDLCTELDGMIRLADDPVWDKFWPPNHFNCRSTVVSINKYDFTQDMITEVPNVEPQEGFGK